MARDYQKKKPTKAEQVAETVLAELGQIYRVLADLDRRITAVAKGKIAPDALADLMLDGQGSADYMKLVNATIDSRLEEQRAKQNPPT